MKPTVTIKHWPCRSFQIKGALVLVVQKPIPKGWKLSGFTPNHHNRFNLLIERKG